MSMPVRFEYTIDPESLADIPADEFAQALVAHLHAQWPGAEITTRVAATVSPCRVTLDDDADPRPYEQRAQEYAQDIFGLLCSK